MKKILLLIFLLSFSQTVLAYSGQCSFVLDSAFTLNPTRYEPMISYDSGTNTATLNETITCSSTYGVRLDIQGLNFNCADNTFIEASKKSIGIWIINSDITVDNCNIKSSHSSNYSFSNGITLDRRADNALIKNSTVSNARTRGIYANRTKIVTLDNIKINPLQHSNGFVSSIGIYFREQTGALLKNSTIDNSGIGVYSIRGSTTEIENVQINPENESSGTGSNTGIYFNRNQKSVLKGSTILSSLRAVRIYNRNSELQAGEITNNVLCSDNPASNHDLYSTGKDLPQTFLDSITGNNFDSTNIKQNWDPWENNSKCNEEPPPPPPQNELTATMSSNPATGPSPLDVTFNATCEELINSDLRSCSLDFGDNSAPYDFSNCSFPANTCSDTVLHTYTATTFPTNYQAILTATDSTSTKDFFIIIIVTEPPEEPPEEPPPEEPPPEEPPAPTEKCIELNALDTISGNPVTVTADCSSPLQGSEKINLTFRNNLGQQVDSGTINCNSTDDFSQFNETGIFSVRGIDDGGLCSDLAFFAVTAPVSTAGIPEIHPVFALLIALSVLFILRNKKQ